MSEVVKIAVISDLHCRHGAGKRLEEINTYLTSEIFPTPVNRNPIESLKIVIQQNKLVPQLLLCPGDITDKCDPQGLISGWKFLEDLKDSFGAKVLAASLGNHDVDSHKLINPNKEAFDLIKRIPNFPTSDMLANNLFWAKGYCIVNDEDFILLIINSSFNHTDKEKAKTSQIEEHTIEMIETDLKGIGDNNKVKIALVHHHPMMHSNMDYKDTDFVDKGDTLLRMLDVQNFDICIHGHKHDPRLNYKNSTAVLAAGSFSSTMNILDIKADNTFHYITIEKSLRRGKIDSWIFSPKDGWKQKKDSYFPCHTGFGFQTNITQLAKDIASWLQQQSKEVISYNELIQHFPNISYLIPDDQIKLNGSLLNSHQVKFIPDLPNIPETISKLYT